MEKRETQWNISERYPWNLDWLFFLQKINITEINHWKRKALFEKLFPYPLFFTTFTVVFLCILQEGITNWYMLTCLTDPGGRSWAWNEADVMLCIREARCQTLGWSKWACFSLFLKTLIPLLLSRKLRCDGYQKRALHMFLHLRRGGFSEGILLGLIRGDDRVLETVGPNPHVIHDEVLSLISATLYWLIQRYRSIVLTRPPPNSLPLSVRINA